MKTRLLATAVAVGLVLAPLAPELCAAGTSDDGCPMMEMAAGDPCHTGAALAMDCCFDGSGPATPTPGQPGPQGQLYLGALPAASTADLPPAEGAAVPTAWGRAPDSGPKLFTLHSSLLI